MPSALTIEVAVEFVEVSVEFALEVTTSVEAAVEVAFAFTQIAPAIARGRMVEMVVVEFEVS